VKTLGKKRFFLAALFIFPLFLFSLFLAFEVNAQLPDNPTAENVYLYEHTNYEGARLVLNTSNYSMEIAKSEFFIFLIL